MLTAKPTFSASRTASRLMWMRNIELDNPSTAGGCLKSLARSKTPTPKYSTWPYIYSRRWNSVIANATRQAAMADDELRRDTWHLWQSRRYCPSCDVTKVCVWPVAVEVLPCPTCQTPTVPASGDDTA